jgi:hypothetical protein
MQQLIFGSFLVSFWAMASGAAATNAISVKTSANFFILGLLIQRRSSRHPIHTFIWGVDHASYFSTFAGCKAFSAGTSDFFDLRRTRIYLLNQQIMTILPLNNRSRPHAPSELNLGHAEARCAAVAPPELS